MFIVLVFVFLGLMFLWVYIDTRPTKIKKREEIERKKLEGILKRAGLMEEHEVYDDNYIAETERRIQENEKRLKEHRESPEYKKVQEEIAASRDERIKDPCNDPRYMSKLFEIYMKERNLKPSDFLKLPEKQTGD